MSVKLGVEFSYVTSMFSPRNFNIYGSFIFRSICVDSRMVEVLVHWMRSSSRSGWDLTKKLIGSWKKEGPCISNIPCF